MMKKKIYYDYIFKQTEKIDVTVNKRYIAMSVIIIFLVFVMLIRLFDLQVSNTVYYQERLELYNARKQTVTPPRGEILAKNGEVLVGNTQKMNITYFPIKNITNSKEWEIAYQFTGEFEIDTSEVVSRDLKDLYIHIMTNSFDTFVYNLDLKQYYNLISDEQKVKYYNLITEDEYEKYNDGILSNNDLYFLRLDRIDKELNLFDDRLIETWVVKQLMDAPTSGRYKLIKSDVTIEEIAKLTETNDNYPGFDIEVDWERYYPYDKTLNGILGNVTSSKQGLPKDRLEYYLALDYAMNEKVGINGLEFQYEDLLNGQTVVLSLSYNEDGQGIFKEEKPGEKGADLQTSIDINLQMYIDRILEDILREHEDNPKREYMNKINVVVSNPKTGDIYSINNVTRTETGEYFYDPANNFTSSYEAGSVVKGASIYIGYDRNVIKPGEVIYDTPIKIKQTPAKASWENLGPINDLYALARSSNVYMFHIAMRLAGTNYSYDGPLYVKPDTYNIMRNYYSLFGLGSYTGIDVPNEAIGYSGISEKGGHILDFIIGQYDTYTNIQLLQYISTIANDGIKLQPRIVNSAYESGNKNLVYQLEPQVITTVDNIEAIERIQQGFHDCVNKSHGICYGFDKHRNIIAAKTGTSEAFVTIENDELVESPHNSVVSYAPFDDPKIAVSCIVPNAWNDGVTQPNLCLEITNKIYNAYFESDYTIE